MASNLQKPSITDIGNLLQKMPEVKLDEFRLTDFVMNEFYKHFDADLFAYMLKMELLEYWTIENQSLTQSWNSQELQRTVTAITEAIKSVTSIAEIAYLDNKDVNSLIGLLASLNVRKFIYILRFMSTVRGSTRRDGWKNERLTGKRILYCPPGRIHERVRGVR